MSISFGTISFKSSDSVSTEPTAASFEGNSRYFDHEAFDHRTDIYVGPISRLSKAEILQKVKEAVVDSDESDDEEEWFDAVETQRRPRAGSTPSNPQLATPSHSRAGSCAQLHCSDLSAHSHVCPPCNHSHASFSCPRTRPGLHQWQSDGNWFGLDQRGVLFWVDGDWKVVGPLTVYL